jgi:putative ABC transport system substrate-binding protein
MRRREFIAALGGATVAWPLVARAQQTERVRRIGFLLPATADDTEFQARVGAFLQELQRLGWSIGRNLRVDIRWEIFQLRVRPKAHESVGSTE